MGIGDDPFTLWNGRAVGVKGIATAMATLLCAVYGFGTVRPGLVKWQAVQPPLILPLIIDLEEIIRWAK
jgi:hypothetical protein